MKAYTRRHAESGISARLPGLECWENQFPNYEITLSYPEFTSVCPKTGLPDSGAITIRYMPRRLCVETKSLKLYLVAFRNLGIFQENAVNVILRDFVRAVKPKWAQVSGEFAARGGLKSFVQARFGKPTA